MKQRRNLACKRHDKTQCGQMFGAFAASGNLIEAFGNVLNGLRVGFRFGSWRRVLWFGRKFVLHRIIMIAQKFMEWIVKILAAAGTRYIISE